MIHHYRATRLSQEMTATNSGTRGPHSAVSLDLTKFGPKSLGLVSRSECHWRGGAACGQGVKDHRKFCKKKWHKGSPEECENHLANFCQNVPSDTRDLFLNRLAARAIERNPQEPSRTKRKLYDHSAQNQTKVMDFIESTRLTEGRIDEINRALVKAFVICEITWKTIESLFFIELLKTLRPGYNPHLKEILSGRLLAQELAVVNQQVLKKLENQENLTLCKLLLH